jgi:hypothetical protein
MNPSTGLGMNLVALDDVTRGYMRAELLADPPSPTLAAAKCQIPP